MRTKQVIVCFLLIILLLGCKTSSTTSKGKTYSGKDGIILNFAGAMPTTFYTESAIPIRGRAPVGAAIGIGPNDGIMGTPIDEKREGDEIRVSAKVTNKGTSFVRGAVYIVGYDPAIISFEGQDDVHTLGQTYRDCTMGIDKLGFGLASGKFQCQDIDLGVLGKIDLGIAVNKQGHVATDIKNLNLGAALDKLFGTDFFEKSKLLGNSDISFSKNDAGTRFDIGFNNPNMDVEYASRGRLFQTLFSFIDFQIGGRGVEYILPPSVTEYPGLHAQYVDFKGRVKGLPEGQEAADQTLLVKTCYLYSTFASPEICIDPDPSAATKKVCRPTRYSGGKGQGAPIAVTSIQQETTPTRVYLKVDIENAGKGQLYDPQKVQRCNPYYPLPADENDLDTVLIGAAYIGKQRLKCDPPLSVRLYKNKGRFTCYYDLKDAFATKSAYLTPLTLELWYGYSTSIKKDIKIKKVG